MSITKETAQQTYGYCARGRHCECNPEAQQTCVSWCAAPLEAELDAQPEWQDGECKRCADTGILSDFPSGVRACPSCAAAPPTAAVAQDERALFEAAMVEAGYGAPVRGPAGDSGYLYEREHDRFVGFQAGRASLSAPTGAQLTEPAERARSEAYDRIDHFLRNNVDDADYAEYSGALELLWGANVAQPEQAQDVPIAAPAGLLNDVRDALEMMTKCIRAEVQPYAWGIYEKGETVSIVDTVKMHEVHPIAVALLAMLAAAPTPPARSESADALDATRLDWLDVTNKRFRMGWKVGMAPAGNVSVVSVIQLGGPPTSIRDAIDAAMAAKPSPSTKEQM